MADNYGIYDINIVMPGKAVYRDAALNWRMFTIPKEIAEVCRIISRTGNGCVCLTKHRNSNKVYMDQLYILEE